MILSAGLTPAWQQILLFDDFRYGEVNRAREAHWCASGKVFNAAMAAHRLGGPALALATVGGPPSWQIEQEFDAEGLPYRWIVTKAATRVCTTLLNRSDGTMTELVENGRPLEAAELEAYLQAYAEEAARAEVAILIGSLPGGTPQDYYRTLLERTSCPVVLDFRGQELLSVLDLEPLLIKPNREELAQTVGRPLDDDRELVSAMRELNDRGAQWVLITQGAGPIWSSSAAGVYRFATPPADQIVNPIGCGDAMAATVAWAVRDGRQMIDAIRLAIAAALENLRTLLPCRLDRARVEARATEVRVEQIA